MRAPRMNVFVAKSTALRMTPVTTPPSTTFFVFIGMLASVWEMDAGAAARERWHSCARRQEGEAGGGGQGAGCGKREAGSGRSGTGARCHENGGTFIGE